MEIQLGRFNTLPIVKTVDFGLYLDGGDSGEILLPSRYCPAGYEIGDELRVFLYLDNEERLVATTLTPLVEVGGFAFLRVSWVNQYGAFLDWGLMKDLFCPFGEQKMKMVVDNSYIIHAHLDEESYRIVASAKIDRYLSTEHPAYQSGDEVPILIGQKTDLGFKVIVDNRFGGLIYDKEIFQSLRTGMRLKAFIKQVREDGKIDLILQRGGMKAVDSFADVLLKYIKDEGGHTPLNDRSDANEIYNTFGVSKKVFKKAAGELYRLRKIRIDDDGLRLT